MKLTAFLACLVATAAGAADSFLVQDGKPGAEIVVAENPPRSTRLAAHELQSCVERITGAKLRIVTQPSGTMPVRILVGSSSQTTALGLDTASLRYGAYRMVSGPDWLALLGDDTDFTPIEPWAKHNGEIASGKLQREWDQITGAQWGVPNPTLYKNRFTLPGDLGLPASPAPAGKIAPVQHWGQDERGSFNAVCGFLQSLGVRWYLPGELGEVLPVTKSIPLPAVDQTVRPDFAMRRFNVRFGVHNADITRWAMRLGMRDPYDIQVAHGMDDMTHRNEILAAHPDWFALYGGKRQNQPGQRLNQLCYSNEELFRETVRNVRAQFDHYHYTAVSVMPPDGYTSICQCKLCEGKDSPERDNRGLLSDYVWDFVNRVAKEVGKTHPDRKVLNCAYGVYTLPPLKIAKLEPNVLVSIVGGRRPTNNRPQEQEDMRQLREAWRAKTDNPLINFENYPFTDRGWYLPSYTPHAMGESINAIKGMMQGEDIWLTFRQDFDKVGLGYNHFPVYFTARMYWGGKSQDVNAMFREYCRLFYGPAAPEMLDFFTYCEGNWQDMEKNKDKADAALARFATALAKAEPASVYGRRLALIDDYLQGLRNKSRQLGQKRGPVPVLRLVGEPLGKIVIDGRLDDEPWEKCPAASVVRLRELQTGTPPVFPTTVKSAWIGRNLYFAIRCEEHAGEKLNIGTTRKDDSALWYGDAVELLIETDARAYYQIAISPSGAVADLDRAAPRNAWFSWDSQAEVATHVAEDHWTVEIRIPVTEDENDPLHQVIGHKPTRSLPWHFNVCRQRLRDNGQELSAFSPTGQDHFHDVMKFAHFFDGNSFQFDAAEPAADFLEAMRQGTELARKGKHAETLAAYIAAAELKTTERQRSHALELAAASASTLRRYDEAERLASAIPMEAVKKTALLNTLINQGKAAEAIRQFGTEDIARWPFWKVADGGYARGRAYVATKQGKEAEADFALALQWTSEPRLRDSILQVQAANRLTNLKDEKGALAAWHAIIDPVTQLGTADQYYAIQGIARILAQRGQFDEALATLGRVDLEKLRGFWRGSLLVSRGDIQLSAGRRPEAIASWREVVDDATMEPRIRKLAEEKLRTP